VSDVDKHQWAVPRFGGTTSINTTTVATLVNIGVSSSSDSPQILTSLTLSTSSLSLSGLYIYLVAVGKIWLSSYQDYPLMLKHLENCLQLFYSPETRWQCGHFFRNHPCLTRCLIRGRLIVLRRWLVKEGCCRSGISTGPLVRGVDHEPSIPGTLLEKKGEKVRNPTSSMNQSSLYRRQSHLIYRKTNWQRSLQASLPTPVSLSLLGSHLFGLSNLQKFIKPQHQRLFHEEVSHPIRVSEEKKEFSSCIKKGGLGLQDLLVDVFHH